MSEERGHGEGADVYATLLSGTPQSVGLAETATGSVAVNLIPMT